jgi:transposase, IS30 family
VQRAALRRHWEGDLIIGRDGHPEIGTLVERTTRFSMLLHMPGDRAAPTVRDAITNTITAPPAQLRYSLNWNRGA